jgi:dipeptide/tripeptide permease
MLHQLGPVEPNEKPRRKVLPAIGIWLLGNVIARIIGGLISSLAPSSWAPFKWIAWGVFFVFNAALILQYGRAMTVLSHWARIKQR